MHGDLDPVLDLLAELLRACDRADARGDHALTTAYVRQAIGGPARTNRILAAAGAE